MSKASSEPEAKPTDPRLLAVDLIGLMQALAEILEKETALVAAGKLRAAAELTLSKTELAGRYQAATVRLKALGRSWIAAEPALVAQMREGHERFQGLLQTNQAVLATAHAVSEGLIRGAASGAAHRTAPQGYGARGQAVAGPPRTAQPVALSRAY